MDSDAQENNFTIIEAKLNSEMKMNSKDRLRAASITNASHKNATLTSPQMKPITFYVQF